MQGAMVQVFLVMPEHTPRHLLTRTIAVALEEDERQRLALMWSHWDLLQGERRQGFYDSENIAQYLAWFQAFPEEYPSIPQQFRRRLLGAMEDWRETAMGTGTAQVQEAYGADYAIADHALLEMAAREVIHSVKTLLLDADGTHFTKQMLQVVYQQQSIQLHRCTPDQLRAWFVGNRAPVRKYHASDKHGEGGKGHWPGASPLLCTHTDAEASLPHALGITPAVLYWKDTHGYIIFRSENDADNQYHAYHIQEKDVPREVLGWL